MLESSRGPSDRGINPPGIRPGYETYRSPYGPAYKIGRNYQGIDKRRFFQFMRTATLFAPIAGFYVLYLASDVPKVRVDIMEKIPFVGQHFHKEVPPEDNPF